GLLAAANADAFERDAPVIGLLLVARFGRQRWRRSALLGAGFLARSGGAPPAFRFGGRVGPQRAHSLLLGLVAGQWNRALGLGGRQVALELLLDEMRKLAVAGGGEENAVRVAQQSLLAGNIRAVGRVIATLVGKLRLYVDEFDAVEIGLAADDIVHHL